jgi:competence protein ComEA
MPKSKDSESSTTPGPRRLEAIFHPRHHRGLIVAILIVLGLTAYRRFTRPISLAPNLNSSTETPQETPTLAGSIAVRLDPNTATESELEALPNIGPGRARNIVEYRESHRAEATPAFNSAADLKRVKGLPASVIEDLEPHLTFPADQPQLRAATTQP